jgi:hypothetical protein
MMLRQEARIRRLTEAPEQCRRAFDVGEEKGQSSRGTSLGERLANVRLSESAGHAGDPRRAARRGYQDPP